MKRLSVLLFVFLCIFGSVFGQKTNEEVINNIQDIRNSKGNKVACDYIEKLLADSSIDSELSDYLNVLWGTITIQELRVAEGDKVACSYIKKLLADPTINPVLSDYLTILWGTIMCNIRHTEINDSITKEYSEYLEKYIMPTVFNDSLIITFGYNFNILHRFTYDYALIQFDSGNYSYTADLMQKVVSWCDTIPEVYGSLLHIRDLMEYYTLLIEVLHQYELALPYIEKSIPLIDSSYGELSQEYAIALYDKSICLNILGQRKESIAIAKKAINIYQSTSNVDAQMLAEMENEVITRELSINGDTNSDQFYNSDQYQLSLAECMYLIVSGKSGEVIPSLLGIIRDMEHEPVLDTLNYTSFVLTLSSAMLSVGNINEARVELENLKQKIDLNILPPQFAVTYYNNVSLINYYLKRYSESIKLGKKALVLYSEINEIGLEYIKLLGNISMCYSELGDYLYSKLYIDEAVDLFTNNVDSAIFHDIAQTLLNNKALVSFNLQDYETAEKIWTGIIDNPINKEHNLTAYGLAANNLAYLYFKQNRWAESIPLLENLRGDNEEYNYYYYQNLALAYLYAGQIDSAILKLKEYNNVALQNCTDIYSHFTENEREYYWHKVAGEMLMMNNLIGYLSQNESAISLAYNNKLFCSNLFLENYSYIMNYISSCSDTELQSKYLEYKQTRSFLSQKDLTEKERQVTVDKIYDLERSIINLIPNLNAQLWGNAGKWNEVKESLSENEVAIEFTIIPNSPTYEDVSWHYGAFIIKKDYDSPKLILLDEKDKIEEMISNNNPNELFINNLYKISTSYQLYKKIWQKIDIYAENSSAIYYSPVGSLLNINFDLLMDKSGSSLQEKYNMIRVSSTKNISKIKHFSNAKYHTASLYGNISYDETVSDMTRESSKYSTYSGENISDALSSRSMNDRGKWGALTYTKNEIDSIYSILKDGNVTTHMFEGHEASEESFKTLDGKSPDIIHLATHGFVIDTEKKAEGNKFVENTTVLSSLEGYLMWCGLMMAGSNNAWTGNFNVNNVEDGILTADEISRLDLSNTKLVVLSACETGRGKVDDVEGVLGLQRAFKKAGAQSIVMSLWKVPDESTSILMTQFYKGLMTGTERHRALKNAMDYVKNLYPDPYYWAGFIMLD